MSRQERSTFPITFLLDMFQSQKLKRLRAMSAPEILYRMCAHLKEKWEKQKILRGTNVESIEHFVSRLNGEAASSEEKLQTILQNFRNRKPFPWLKEQEEFLQLYDSHFSGHREKTLTAAERYCRRTFEIFDQTLTFADNIDWHFDPLEQKSVRLDYWSDINYYANEVVKEVKYIWELNRCQFFVTLAKASYVTGNEKYARALFDFWADWIDKNPYKMGVNWASSLECAFRIFSWTWALYFVQNSGQLFAGLYARLLQAIHQHAQFIAGHLSKFSSANNHLIGEALGLIYAGSYFPEFAESEQWRQQGFAILFREMLTQVHEDGVSKEQATWYQKYVFDFGVLAMVAAKETGQVIPDEITHRLEKMAEFIAACADRNGNLPHIGDDDGGEALRLAESAENPYKSLLSTAAVLFKRPHFKAVSKKISEATFWLLGESAVRTYEQLPADYEFHRLIHFKSGGYFVLCQQQPLEQKMILDYGSLGLGALAAHGHADALSIMLSIDGVPVLIDSGAYLYLGAKQERNYFRGASAHNTIIVDEQDQSEILGPFQWGRRAECKLESIEEKGETLAIQISHNGFRRQKVHHCRRMEMRDGFWLCKDKISGIGNHQIDAYFHCAPCEISQNRHKVAANFSTFKIEFDFAKNDSVEKEEIRIEQAWHSRCFGQREPHRVIRRQIIGPLPIELTTIIKVYAQII